MRKSYHLVAFLCLTSMLTSSADAQHRANSNVDEFSTLLAVAGYPVTGRVDVDHGEYSILATTAATESEAIAAARALAVALEVEVEVVPISACDLQLFRVYVERFETMEQALVEFHRLRPQLPEGAWVMRISKVVPMPSDIEALAGTFSSVRLIVGDGGDYRQTIRVEDEPTVAKQPTITSSQGTILSEAGTNRVKQITLEKALPMATVQYELERDLPDGFRVVGQETLGKAVQLPIFEQEPEPDTAESEAAEWRPGSIDPQVGGWTIVVASHTSEEEAYATAAMTSDVIRSTVQDPTVDVIPKIVNNEKRYRVVVGQLATRKGAATLLEGTADILPPDSWITRIQAKAPIAAR